MADSPNPIRSETGRTLGGAPLALSYEPPPDLAPWFCWASVAAGTQPDGHVTRCGMLSDLPCLRLTFGGKWLYQMGNGPRTLEPGDEGMTLYFGPQDRYTPVYMGGTFKAMTLYFTAGAIPKLGGPDTETMLNRVIDYDEFVGRGQLTSRIPVNEPYERWFEAADAELRKFVAVRAPKEPDPIITTFERDCLANPNFSISEFAESHRVSSRTLSRKVARSYGIGPKQVLRRARALDMAAGLLGVALKREEIEMQLRYYDEPHRIREMRHFFGMTPGQLENGAHPILRTNMEARQNRRLRSLDQIGADEPRPWRDPNVEPRSLSD